MGYSPRDRKESDTTERLHFHFHFILRKLLSELTGQGCIILIALDYRI